MKFNRSVVEDSNGLQTKDDEDDEAQRAEESQQEAAAMAAYQLKK